MKSSRSVPGEVKTDIQAWSILVARELGYRNAWLNLNRYETAIERQIYKALHELIRLQMARRGEKPPAPLAIDVELSHQDLNGFVSQN